MYRTAWVSICFIFSECKISTLGGDYTGHVGTTETGKTCQRWDAQFPHSHSMTDPRMFPDDTMDDAANYCRNPDVGLKGPWCYTTDPSERWEFCEIDYCYEGKIKKIFRVTDDIRRSPNACFHVSNRCFKTLKVFEFDLFFIQVLGNV